MFQYHRHFNVVKIGKIAFQKFIPSNKKRVLVPGADATTGVFAVAGIEGISNVHSADDLREWGKWLLIEGGAIIFQVDEYLRAAAVRVFKGKSHHPAGV